MRGCFWSILLYAKPHTVPSVVLYDLRGQFNMCNIVCICIFLYSLIRMCLSLIFVEHTNFFLILHSSFNIFIFSFWNGCNPTNPFLNLIYFLLCAWFTHLVFYLNLITLFHYSKFFFNFFDMLTSFIFCSPNTRTIALWVSIFVERNKIFSITTGWFKLPCFLFTFMEGWCFFFYYYFFNIYNNVFQCCIRMTFYLGRINVCFIS